METTKRNRRRIGAARGPTPVGGRSDDSLSWARGHRRSVTSEGDHLMRGSMPRNFRFAPTIVARSDKMLEARREERSSVIVRIITAFVAGEFDPTTVPDVPTSGYGQKKVPVTVRIPAELDSRLNQHVIAKKETVKDRTFVVAAGLWLYATTAEASALPF